MGSLNELVKGMERVNEAFTDANWRDRLSEIDKMLFELQTRSLGEYHGQRAELAKKLLEARVHSGVYDTTFAQAADDCAALADALLTRLRDDHQKALAAVEQSYRKRVAR